MSFANSHLSSCVGELHKMKEDTGDFTLTCQGNVIKAHSYILSMGSVILTQYCVIAIFEYHPISGLSISRRR